MKTAVIVQARMASTRLPGKILKTLGQHTVLEEVLRRCAAVRQADGVVCAIPDQPQDDAIIPVAERAGAVVTRGSQSDVLQRYANAARAVDAEIVLRVTSDCPLIDPDLCGQVIDRLVADGADYACNNMPRSFPHGLDCEAMTAKALYRAEREASAADEREHVTPWLRRHPRMRRVTVEGPGGEAAEQRWTLDYPEDYDFFVRLFAHLPQPPATPPWRDVLGLLDVHPAIAQTNASRRVHA